MPQAGSGKLHPLKLVFINRRGKDLGTVYKAGKWEAVIFWFAIELFGKIFDRRKTLREVRWLLVMLVFAKVMRLSMSMLWIFS